jgi:hypothetical protein
MMRLLTIVVFVIGLIDGNAQQSDPKYFNESPPGIIPKVFAPGKVSMKDEFEFGAIFSNDRSEFYYGVYRGGKAETRVMKFENGKWGLPVKILSHDVYSYNDPFLTPTIIDCSLFQINLRQVPAPRRIMTSGISNVAQAVGVNRGTQGRILTHLRMSTTSLSREKERCIIPPTSRVQRKRKTMIFIPRRIKTERSRHP